MSRSVEHNDATLTALLAYHCFQGSMCWRKDVAYVFCKGFILLPAITSLNVFLDLGQHLPLQNLNILKHCCVEVKMSRSCRTWNSSVLLVSKHWKMGLRELMRTLYNFVMLVYVYFSCFLAECSSFIYVCSVTCS